MSSNVIFWDVDGTLLATSLERLFISFLRTRGQISLPGIAAQGLLQSVSRFPPRWQDLKLCYVRGLEAELIDNLAAACWREAIKPRLRPNLVSIIRELNDRDLRQILLTGTPRFLAAPLARFLGVEHLIAAEPETLESKLTGGLRCPHPYGKRKLTAAADWLDQHGCHWRQTTAVADSWADRHLLRAVARALVVNPGRRLRREAQRRGWTQISSTSQTEQILGAIQAGA
jgi:phosphoserine phosphatase